MNTGDVLHEAPMEVHRTLPNVDQDLGSLSTRAAQLSATFTEISSALEELLAQP